MNTNVAAINHTITADNQKTSVAGTIFAARYFLPIASTVGWVLGFSLGHIAFFETLAFILIAIGFLATITVCPLKLITVPLRCCGKGFVICRSFIPVYGVADLCAAIFGVTLGLMFGLAAVLGTPAIFTIKKFLEQE